MDTCTAFGELRLGESVAVGNGVTAEAGSIVVDEMETA